MTEHFDRNDVFGNKSISNEYIFSVLFDQIPEMCSRTNVPGVHMESLARCDPTISEP